MLILNVYAIILTTDIEHGQTIANNLGCSCNVFKFCFIFFICLFCMSKRRSTQRFSDLFNFMFVVCASFFLIFILLKIIPKQKVELSVYFIPTPYAVHNFELH